MLPESKAKKMPITQEHLDAINAVRDLDEALLEVDAVAAGGTSNSKTGTVCANASRETATVVSTRSAAFSKMRLSRGPQVPV